MGLAKKICREPGCMHLTTGARCSDHKGRGIKNRSGDPFYNSKLWRALRQRRLDSEPLCRHCKEVERVTEASVVDHVLPRTDRPDLELDYDNTQSLCASCHNRKTMSENQARWYGGAVRN